MATDKEKTSVVEVQSSVVEVHNISSHRLAVTSEMIDGVLHIYIDNKEPEAPVQDLERLTHHPMNRSRTKGS